MFGLALFCSFIALVIFSFVFGFVSFVRLCGSFGYSWVDEVFSRLNFRTAWSVKKQPSCYLFCRRELYAISIRIWSRAWATVWWDGPNPSCMVDVEARVFSQLNYILFGFANNSNWHFPTLRPVCLCCKSVLTNGAWIASMFIGFAWCGPKTCRGACYRLGFHRALRWWNSGTSDPRFEWPPCWKRRIQWKRRDTSRARILSGSLSKDNQVLSFC